MKNNRLNKDRAFYKYVRVIKSCQTDEHINTTRKIIHNFYEVFRDLDSAEELLKIFVTQKGIVVSNELKSVKII